jgi:beta-RFAP synthase
MRTRDQEAVFVETSARLHFGVLDLRGSRGRWFGGIGASTKYPTLRVSAAPAETLVAHGEDADRAREFARLFLAHHDLRGGAAIHVHGMLPAHVGLGSGTQLALAVARALAELYGLDTDARSLARAVGRGKRSAIGTWTFDDGGLVVEGGRRAGSGNVVR